MSIPLIIVGYSLVFLLFFALSIFVFIIVRRIALRSRERKLETLSEELETEILLAMSAPDEGVARKVAETYSGTPRILTRLVVDYAMTISGPERDRLKLIYDLALKERLLRDIRSHFIHIRLRAIRPFILFVDEEDFPLLLTLMQGNPAVRLAVIDTLSDISHPVLIDWIFQTFAETPEPDLRASMNLMYSLGRKIENHIRPYLNDSMSAPKLGALIEMVGAIPLPSMYDLILEFTGHPDMEVRVRVARALGRLNILVKPVTRALAGLTKDEAWEVQAQALKSLGRLHVTTSLETLRRGMFSPHWHCRRNAGFALANLGDAGLKHLKKIAAQRADRYAADMARMVLEETAFFQPTG
jgi:HEAT repeat protein